MFEKLDITRMAQALAAHSGARMGVIARNVANADTPGYRAADIAAFADVYATEPGAMRATRAGHVGALTGGAGGALIEVPGGGSPNGNSVSLEAEMVRGAEVRQSHNMALAVYKSVSDILRTSLGRGR
jgi:flagellar basal-body rod protein FlgB